MKIVFDVVSVLLVVVAVAAFLHDVYKAWRESRGG